VAALRTAAKRERRKTDKKIVISSDSMEDLDELISRIGCLERVAEAAAELISYNATGAAKGFPKWDKYFSVVESAIHELRQLDT